jgi:hypothetical protein
MKNSFAIERTINGGALGNKTASESVPTPPPANTFPSNSAQSAMRQKSYVLGGKSVFTKDFTSLDENTFAEFRATYVHAKNKEAQLRGGKPGEKQLKLAFQIPAVLKDGENFVGTGCDLSNFPKVAGGLVFVTASEILDEMPAITDQSEISIFARLLVGDRGTNVPFFSFQEPI